MAPSGHPSVDGPSIGPASASYAGSVDPAASSRSGSEAEGADGWLGLLLRDASPAELTAFGRTLGEGGQEQAVRALELRALLDDQARRAAELGALSDIAGKLSSLHTPQDLLPEIVAQARHLLRVDLAYLALVDDVEAPDPVVRIEVTDGAITPELVGVELPMDQGVVGWVIRNVRPRWSRNYQHDPTFSHSSSADAAAGAENMHSVLGAPLAVRGRAIGALFAGVRSQRDFSENEVTLLSALAQHAAIALDNADSMERLARAHAQLDRRSERLARSLSWDERLRDVVLRGGGVDALLSEVSTAVGVPVRFVGVEAGHPATAGEGDRAAGGEGDGDESAAGIHAVEAAGRLLGWLVPEGEPAGRVDAELAIHRAAPTVALTLVAQEAAAQAAGRARNLHLLELLTTREDDQPGAPEIRQAGLDPMRRYVVAVADEQAQAVLSEPQWLTALPAGTAVLSHRQDAIVVTPASPQDVAAVMEAAGVRAAVSDAVPALTGLHQAYTGVVETMKALRALGDAPTVALSGDVGFHRLLLGDAGRGRVREAFERQLGEVRDEQERRGIPLLETMAAYLDAGRSPRATASALGVHVNTVYQRLGVLDGLLGREWRQSDQSLELQVLLRLRAADRRLRGLG